MSSQSFEDNLQKFVEELKDEEQMTEKQRSILRASIKLFAEKGFHASSTAEIAKEAGVAEGTIFRHYKSKKDILIAVVAPVLLKFAAPFIIKDIRIILNETSKLSFGEVIGRLLKNRLDLIGTNMKHFQIMLQEAFFHEELREALIESVVKEAMQLARGLIEERIASGELRPFPPEVIVRMFVSSMFSLVLFKYVVKPEEYGKHTDEEQIAFTVDILLNGLVNR